MMFGKKRQKPEAFGEHLKGLLCGSVIRLEKNEASWSVLFAEKRVIVTDIWRLIGSKGIVVTDEDHGHQFGLPSPVDAESQANKALADHRITDVDFDQRTGDLALHIEGGLTLQILTTSMAYEIWTMYEGGETVAAVGNGGVR